MFQPLVARERGTGPPFSCYSFLLLLAAKTAPGIQPQQLTA